MNKLAALAFVLLLLVPIAAHGFIYVKPSNDNTYRPGGVQRFNEYFYDPRIQSKKSEFTVYLTPPNPPIFSRDHPNYYPRGTAKITSVRTQYTPQLRVHLEIKDVRPSHYDHTVYQAWLYDSDTGYALNMGQFQVEEGNTGEIIASGSFYVDSYEYVMVTREPENDMDPRPSNDEVLLGLMTQKFYHEPTPQLGKKAQYGYSYYLN